MNINKAHIGFCIDRELLDKYRYVCAYEGRTMVGQIVHMIRWLIRDFEAANGKIDLDE